MESVCNCNFLISIIYWPCAYIAYFFSFPLMHVPHITFHDSLCALSHLNPQVEQQKNHNFHSQEIKQQKRTATTQFDGSFCANNVY